jgi:hypothetical protein
MNSLDRVLSFCHYQMIVSDELIKRLSNIFSSIYNLGSIAEPIRRCKRKYWKIHSQNLKNYETVSVIVEVCLLSTFPVQLFEIVKLLTITQKYVVKILYKLRMDVN